MTNLQNELINELGNTGSIILGNATKGLVVDKFYVDADGVWLRIFNENFDDDRHNVVDIEGESIDSVREIVQNLGYDDTSLKVDDLMKLQVSSAVQLILLQYLEGYYN